MSYTKNPLFRIVNKVKNKKSNKFLATFFEKNSRSGFYIVLVLEAQSLKHEIKVKINWQAFACRLSNLGGLALAVFLWRKQWNLLLRSWQKSNNL